MMPELCPQEQARDIATLAAWVVYEQSFLRMLTDAGCSQNEARMCMSGEVA